MCLLSGLIQMSLSLSKVLQEAAAKLPKAEAFWQEACRLGANLRYPGFVKLAQLVMVMVPGSVEDEQMFSAMKYLEKPQRNSLRSST